MSDFNIKIDPKSAEQGAAKVVKSFESIEKAANKLSKEVGPKFTKLKNEVASLSKLQGPSAGLSSKLKELGDALRNLRGPSPQAVKNIKALFASFSGMKGPSTASISALASLKTAMQGFTAPSAATVKNLRGLFSALSSLRVPTNLQNIVTGLGQIATAARRANSAVSSLNVSLRGTRAPNLRLAAAGGGGLGGSSGGIVGGGGRGGFGGGQIKSLGGDFRLLRSESISLSAALLRTQVALQSLLAIAGTGKMIDIVIQFQAINAGMLAVTGNSMSAAREMGFARKTAEELGISVLNTGQGFMSLLASIQGTIFTSRDAESIFGNMSKAARVLHLSADDTSGVFRALTQIMSKNSLQSEELRGQLGDRLPGAFSKMAKAMEVSTSKLSDMMKKGQITGQVLREALLKFAQQFADDTAPGLQKSIEGLQASFGRATTAFSDFIQVIGESGFEQTVSDISKKIKEFFDSKEGYDLAIKLGKGIRFLWENIEILAKIIGAFIAAGLLKSLYGMMVSLYGAVMKLASGLAILKTAGGWISILIGALVGGVALVVQHYTDWKSTGDLVNDMLTDQKSVLDDMKSSLETYIGLTRTARQVDWELYLVRKKISDQEVKVTQLKLPDMRKNILETEDQIRGLEKVLNDRVTVYNQKRTGTLPGVGEEINAQMRAKNLPPVEEQNSYKKEVLELESLRLQLEKNKQAYNDVVDAIRIYKKANIRSATEGDYGLPSPTTPIIDDTSSSDSGSKRDLLSQIRNQIQAYEKLKLVREAAMVGPKEVTKAEAISNQKDLLEDLRRGADDQTKFAKATAEASEMLDKAGISGKDLAEQLVNLGIATKNVEQATALDEMNRKLEDSILVAQAENEALKQGNKIYDEYILRQEAIQQLKDAEIETTETNVALREDYLRSLRDEARLKEAYARDNDIQKETEWLLTEISLRAQNLPNLERTLAIERELFDLKNGGASETEIERRRELLDVNAIFQLQNETLADQMETLAEVGKDMGDAFADAFTRIVVKGESAKEVLADILGQMAEMILRSAMSGLFSNIFSMIGGGLLGSSMAGVGGTGGLGGPGGLGFGNALGSAFDHGQKMQFARGGSFTNGVVDKTTNFNMGQMGEAGPEAIMPLARGAGGKLGVVSSGGGGDNITIVNNINVNGSSGGSGSQDDAKFAEMLGKKIKQATEDAVYKVLDKEARPGGRFGAGLR